MAHKIKFTVPGPIKRAELVRKIKAQIENEIPVTGASHGDSIIVKVNKKSAQSAEPKKK